MAIGKVDAEGNILVTFTPKNSAGWLLTSKPQPTNQRHDRQSQRPVCSPCPFRLLRDDGTSAKKMKTFSAENRWNQAIVVSGLPSRSVTTQRNGPRRSLKLKELIVN